MIRKGLEHDYCSIIISNYKLIRLIRFARKVTFICKKILQTLFNTPRIKKNSLFARNFFGAKVFRCTYRFTLTLQLNRKGPSSSFKLYSLLHNKCNFEVQNLSQHKCILDLRQPNSSCLFCFLFSQSATITSL